MRNLLRAGYARGWRLVMRPARERPGTHDGYKRRARRAITRRGFRILANVGDQHSDLRGGFALRRFKLPEPDVRDPLTRPLTLPAGSRRWP